MNKVLMLGRLTRDPVVRQSQGAEPMSIARFNVALNRAGKKKEGAQTADFPSCVAFGKTAESIEKYFHKGQMIAIEGHIVTGNYTNKDGQKVYTTEVAVDHWEFAASKAESEGSAEPAQSAAGSDDFMTIPEGIESELPFH